MGHVLPTRPARTAKLDLRLSPEAKRLLHAAAQATHRSVSDFVLESALARAEEALADRTRFTLDGGQWDAFMAALDAPPRDLPRLRQLFRDAMPFDPAPGA